ncbi:hypothetical protein GCM10010381_62860 [Streptomyces xantholiticus]|nr:hypothetical protein GCM10010381_62860 [Streptomyces xantholiticus]
MTAPGIQPPFQFVALHDQRPRDQPVALAQRLVADVHQQCPGGRSLEGLFRAQPLEALPYALQVLVDTQRFAHCQSSGRSTCSRRRTAPDRLKRLISGSGG